MDTAIVTGSGGLIGAEAVRHFSAQGFRVVGIDNNMRATFFGNDSSTAGVVSHLKATIPTYVHEYADIRNRDAMDAIFNEYGSDIKLVIHTAAQPSHDYAAKDPCLDFAVNALGTMNVLEATRVYAPDAVFIFTSTNKVYGDRPNQLPLVELDTRWSVQDGSQYEGGIDEGMPIDACLHSVFGASKVAADVMVQEYGRYFGMRTVCFRGGCLTGPGHKGAELHGFLSYLAKCCVTGQEYHVFGHKGKQVRDNIHCADLVAAFDAFYHNPRCGEVYNIGGGHHSNCSVREAIGICEELTGKRMRWTYHDEARKGDHVWWITDNRKFMRHYPEWPMTYDVPRILGEIVGACG